MVWFDWVRRGDAHRLPAVLRHNRWDLVSLAALLCRLADVHGDPGVAGADPFAAARAWERAGETERGFRLLCAHSDGLDRRGWLELARRHRRRGDWPAARRIWERQAALGCFQAAECLAKYHEHVARDATAALAAAAALPESEAARRRQARLRRKAARPANGRLGLG